MIHRFAPPRSSVYRPMDSQEFLTKLGNPRSSPLVALRPEEAYGS